jgi:hypothetical protein
VRHDAELGQMCAQCIDHLSTLAHQQIARAMLRQLPLLLSLTLANSEQAYRPRGMRNMGSLSTIS